MCLFGGKIWWMKNFEKKIEMKTFLSVFDWVGKKENKWWKLHIFSPNPLKIFSPKWREDWRENLSIIFRGKCPCTIAHGLHSRCFSLHFFFFFSFFFPSRHCLPFFFSFFDVAYLFFFFLFLFYFIFLSFFSFDLLGRRCQPLLIFFFFFFFFDLLGRLVQYYFLFFSFFCISFGFFFFRCDFFYENDFYFLINLGDWYFFWLFITFLVLIGHHFLIRVYA